jgi:hypothetical protein
MVYKMLLASNPFLNPSVMPNTPEESSQLEICFPLKRSEKLAGH